MTCPIVAIAMPTVSLQRATIVNGGAGQKPWIVTDVINVNGQEFVPLLALRGLNHFVGVEVAATTFADELQAIRNEACLMALNEGEPNMDGQPRAVATPSRWSASWATRRRFEAMKKTAKRLGIEVVTMSLPRVEHNGVVVGPMTMQTPFTLKPNSVVAVPLDATALEYIRFAYLASDAVARRDRVTDVQGPRGSYFDERRGPHGSFVGRRPKTSESSSKAKGNCEYMVIPVMDGDQEGARLLVQQFIEGHAVAVPRRVRPRRGAAASDDMVALEDDTEDEDGSAAAEVNPEDCDEVD